MFANYVFALSNKVGHNAIAGNWDMDGNKFMEHWWLRQNDTSKTSGRDISLAHFFAPTIASPYRQNLTTNITN